MAQFWCVCHDRENGSSRLSFGGCSKIAEMRIRWWHRWLQLWIAGLFDRNTWWGVHVKSIQSVSNDILDNWLCTTYVLFGEEGTNHRRTLAMQITFWGRNESSWRHHRVAIQLRLTTASRCCSLYLIDQVEIIDVDTIWADPDNRAYIYAQSHPSAQCGVLGIFCCISSISLNNITIHCVYGCNCSDFRAGKVEGRLM